jgi:TolB-like protein
MNGTTKAVFLSYASQDAETAKKICDALRTAGIEVWFDRNELVGGDAWDQKIRGQIRECSLFVPVISSATQARREGYFRIEWKLAAQRTQAIADGTPFLLPVMTDTTSDAEALVPSEFRAVQWTRLPKGEATAAFVAHVRKLLGAEPEATSAVFGDQRGGVSSASSRPHAAYSAADLKSVAVLAFTNLSGDRDNEYFSDGISEELLNVLAKIPRLKVSARTSAFHFKGKDTPIPEIARQLGVAYVVEGSVRKSGDRVRITAQLIEAASAFHVWSDSFTRDLKDIFAVQDEIAGLIAQNLKLKLNVASVARVVNPEAYQLFLQGRAIFNRGIPDEYAEAVECYKASLAIDDGSAITWACLGTTYTMSAALGVLPVASGFELARDAAKKAISLDEGLTTGYATMGVVQFAYDWDWSRASQSLERAAALAPGDAGTMSFLSNLAQAVGQTERALQIGRRALDLDPLNTLSGYIFGKALFQAGLFPELEKHSEHLITLNPGVPYGHIFLTYACLFQGKIAAAAEAVERMPLGFFRLVCQAHAHYAMGLSLESDAALAELKAKHASGSAYQIAEIHAGRGETDDAFNWLEISYRQRDPGMTWLKNDAFLRNLRTDARWPALLRKMNLAGDQPT